MSYFPLDRDILTSSIWAQGTPEQLKLWFYLMLAANPRTGIVEDSDPGIALRCGLSIEATTAGLEWLAAPDAFSRTKDHDGRRIERLPGGGIRLLTYERHRDRDHSTPRWRRWKERQKDANAQTAANGVGDQSNTVANYEHEHEHGNGKEQRTPPPPGALRPAGRSWSAEASDDWISRFGGTAPGGEIGKALKPLVATHTWPVVRAAWRNYLGQAEAEYVSASRFAKTYGRWSGDVAAQPRPSGKETLGSRMVDETTKFLKGGRA